VKYKFVVFQNIYVLVFCEPCLHISQSKYQLLNKIREACNNQRVYATINVYPAIGNCQIRAHVDLYNVLGRENSLPFRKQCQGLDECQNQMIYFHLRFASLVTYAPWVPLFEIVAYPFIDN
jgi:hypothetical protein